MKINMLINFKRSYKKLLVSQFPNLTGQSYCELTPTNPVRVSFPHTEETCSSVSQPLLPMELEGTLGQQVGEQRPILSSERLPRDPRTPSLPLHQLAWPWCSLLCHWPFGLRPPGQVPQSPRSRAHSGPLQVSQTSMPILQSTVPVWICSVGESDTILSCGLGFFCFMTPSPMTQSPATSWEDLDPKV